MSIDVVTEPLDFRLVKILEIFWQFVGQSSHTKKIEAKACKRLDRVTDGLPGTLFPVTVHRRQHA